MTSSHLGGPQRIDHLIRERDALKTKNERLEMALAASGVVGLWDWMIDTDLLHGDANFARLYGLEPEAAASGLSMAAYQQFVVADDLDALRRHIRETFDHGTDFLVEYRLSIPGQPLRWVECKGKLIHDDCGKPVRFSGTTVDITQRKLTDEKVRASACAAQENAERVQLALEAGAIVGTWVWNIKLNQFAVDAGFAKAFGLDPALGFRGISLEKVLETVHPDDKAGLVDAVAAAVARGGSYMHQYRVRRRDGVYYWVEASGRVELAQDGSPERFPGVLIDISTRREVEAERDRVAAELRDLNATLEQRVKERTEALVDAQEALRQSQKMEAVGQLTGGLAHDFNNLLTGIAGALELMRIRTLNGQFKDFERYIQTAQNGVKRGTSLTHRLLAFARRETLDPRADNVNRLVEGLQELIQRAVGAGISVDVTAADGLWNTMLDASQFENALLNLCLNARDAMPDGGRIAIETANEHLDDSHARRLDMAPGHYVSVCVSDTGMGIAPEVLRKVFEPFFTTKPAGVGTGLGLSMVYGFAKQSGGQVRIDSTPGNGTTVCIYLPRHEGDTVDAPAVNDADASAMPVRTRIVLVVDDEPMIRMLVLETLRDLGYSALEAGDSATALQILQSEAQIDLLVSDLGLPGGVGGAQIAEAARQGRPDLKVLFITGYGKDPVLAKDRLGPCTQVLMKPFDINALASCIRSMMGGDAQAHR